MKILVLLSRIPYPTEKGDKLRAFHQIRCLSRSHEIYLFALTDSGVHPEAEEILSKYCKEIYFFPIGKTGMVGNIIRAFFTGKPFQVGYFFRQKLKRKITSVSNQIKPDQVYCQLIRMAEYARNLPYPKTLDYQDVFSIGMKRRQQTSSWWLKPFFGMEYRRVRNYENSVFSDFDHHTIISQPDRDLIPHPDKELIQVIPNGVDHEYFKPFLAERKYDIVFTGNMGYPPNVDAAGFLVNNILPRIRKVIPGVTLLIAGANPHPSVLSLASSSVTVTGWIPDIRKCYASARLFMAPMRIGTGLQNKLLEAMSMQLPCITSDLAYRALNTPHSGIVLVGNDEVDYASHAVRILSEQAYSNDLALKSREFVRTHFDWEKTAMKLESVFNQ